MQLYHQSYLILYGIRQSYLIDFDYCKELIYTLGRELKVCDVQG